MATEPTVGDGNAVGAARPVARDRLWRAEWLLDVDHPFGVVQGSEIRGECLAVGRHGVISEERQAASVVRGDKLLEAQVPEQP
jgi:hypothetical protein